MLRLRRDTRSLTKLFHLLASQSPAKSMLWSSSSASRMADLLKQIAEQSDRRTSLVPFNAVKHKVKSDKEAETGRQRDRQRDTEAETKRHINFRTKSKSIQIRYFRREGRRERGREEPKPSRQPSGPRGWRMRKIYKRFTVYWQLTRAWWILGGDHLHILRRSDSRRRCVYGAWDKDGVMSSHNEPFN